MPRIRTNIQKQLGCLLAILTMVSSLHPFLSSLNRNHHTARMIPLECLRVWVEDADDGIVGDDNVHTLALEGRREVCHKAVKAWASGVDSSDHRLLCAGALVERPNHVSDAWTADAVMNNGGPNLQLQGAIQVLDDLFLCHLKRYIDPIEALKHFVVQCGELESEWSCASHMAALARGFVPLRRCQHTALYADLDNDNKYLDSMVFDFKIGRTLYQQAAMIDNDMATIAERILCLLPDPDEMERYVLAKVA